MAVGLGRPNKNLTKKIQLGVQYSNPFTTPNQLPFAKLATRQRINPVFDYSASFVNVVD